MDSIAAPNAAAGHDQAVLSSVRDYLVSANAVPAGAIVTDETPLLAGGGLDSLGIVQLVVFLSESFGIEVSDEDFVPENFETVGHLVGYVARRRAGG